MTDRRQFLKAGAAAGAFFIVASATPSMLRVAEAMSRAEPWGLDPLLRFDATGRVTVLVPTPEMGQGGLTSAAQIVADELDLALDAVSVELMPFVGKFDASNRAVHDGFHQETGGSTSTEVTWMQLRRAAAFLRAELVEAAAKRWRVSASSLRTAGGRVRREGTDESVAYGDLVALVRDRSDLLRVNNVEPKPRDAWHTVGTDQRNVRARDIVTGAPLYGLDVRVPGMLHAVIVRCPFVNGELATLDESSVATLPGVRAVVRLERRPLDRARPQLVAPGVGVVAGTLWEAMKAARSLRVTWRAEDSASANSDAMQVADRQALENATFDRVQDVGDVDAALRSALHQVDVTYQHPHWAHTCMEPHNCVADVRPDAATVWVGHQNLPGVMNAVAAVTGLRAAQVQVHLQRMGTGLGRKYVDDFVIEATLLSRAVGAPVKLVWTREDEMAHDFYNPAHAYRVRAGIDADGALSAWHTRAAGDRPHAIVASDLPAGLVPHSRGETTRVRRPVPIGAWRGPLHNTGAWVIQSALDELAAAAGRDPLEFLLSVYGGKPSLKSPNWPFADLHPERFVVALERVARESGWGRALPLGRGRGIAVHQTFSGLAAHVVEVEWRSAADYTVHRVTTAIDCGLVINPLGVRAQSEGGVVDGLCAARYGHMRFDAGRPITTNFTTYRKLRLREAPREIDTHLLDFGDTAPRGVGEVSLPPVIPALTNAIFAASGIRIRRLPIAEWR